MGKHALQGQASHKYLVTELPVSEAILNNINGKLGRQGMRNLATVFKLCS